MKIAYLITRMDEYGGAQIHVRDLCLWLKGQGHQPVVLSGRPGRVSDFLESQDIEYHEIPDLARPIRPRDDWRALAQVRDALRAIKPDLLSCHSSKAGLIGRIAARMTKTPVIFTAHGWAFTDGVPTAPRMIYRVIERAAGFLSDHIITVSDYDRDLARRANIVPANRITAIHNGMPFLPALSRARHDSPMRLLMVARVGPQKDHALLIDALKDCRDLDWTLDFVGGGDDAALRAQVQAAGLATRIHFRGEREDIADRMQNADLYCLISKWEGFPRSILEAMRASLPVIATNVAGVPEAVNNGETGFTVPPGDRTALVTALRTLIADRARAEQMGQKGRLSFETRFTFAAMAGKTLSLYQTIVDNQGIRPGID